LLSDDDKLAHTGDNGSGASNMADIEERRARYAARAAKNRDTA
jgi:hypothetical protein